MRRLFLALFLTTSIIGNCAGFDYKQWWENWYANDHNSGPGSRGVLAEFKADVINDFIAEKKIQSAIEFGCGDGYILSLIHYPVYFGMDVSKTAIEMCRNMFQSDLSKYFIHYDLTRFRRNFFGDFDLVVCLDVLYHIIDEEEYIKTLDDIFSFSAPYVILYTTLVDNGIPPTCPEILHRDIFCYLKKYTDYEISIKNQKYPDLTRAYFIFLVKKGSSG